jgi:hypothetical protein
MPELPDGITLERNRDLRGLARTPWLRRALLCAIAVLPLLALLNVFGQKPSTSSAASPVASMSVTAPSRLRGGLMFQVRVRVVARRRLGQLQLAFDRGWWNSMTVNSIAPEPSSETSENGTVVLSYEKLPAGQSLICWINFQVNPTNVGKRREDVSLLDGEVPLLHIHRSVTIFP